MTTIFGSIFLGGTGLIFGMMVGKSIIKEEEMSNAATFITFAVGVFCMCGSLWFGLLNNWI